MVSIANWLQAWAGVDVAALAQYLAHTLRAGQAFDLLLLKELVSVMTVRPYVLRKWHQSVKILLYQARMGCARQAFDLLLPQ